MGTQDTMSADEIEKRLYHLEAVLPALPRIEQKLDKLVELTAAFKLVEGRQGDYRIALNDLDVRLGKAQEGLNALENSVASKYSWVRGAMLAATVFWFILQGGVAYMLTDTLEKVDLNSASRIQVQEQIFSHDN